MWRGRLNVRFSMFRTFGRFLLFSNLLYLLNLLNLFSMDFQENAPIGRKTTMRIGGAARYYAELKTSEDAETAYNFAKEKHVPLIMLGGGSNTVFADGIVDAVVCRITADATKIHGNTVMVEAGKILAVLINELAEQGLDLSPLSGIPGHIGGAAFGNAGQGYAGVWFDSFVRVVHIFVDGTWQNFSRDDCDYHYRESWFKDQTKVPSTEAPPIIWSVTLEVPFREPADIKADVEKLLKKRIETQPHLKTAGSCFKSMPDGTPAWKLIEAAGLRGLKIGGVEVSEKHANFLLNTNSGTFADVVNITKQIKAAIPEIAAIEMRLYGANGLVLGY